MDSSPANLILEFQYPELTFLWRDEAIGEDFLELGTLEALRKSDRQVLCLTILYRTSVLFLFIKHALSNEVVEQTIIRIREREIDPALRKFLVTEGIVIRRTNWEERNADS
jgi:hypothetical protein